MQIWPDERHQVLIFVVNIYDVHEMYGDLKLFHIL